MNASQIWMALAAGSAAIAGGIVLLRASRFPALAWLGLTLGVGVLGLLVLMQFTGRFGPGQLWFRAPTFYLAALILLAVFVWWLMRPAPRMLRFGLPVVLLALLGVAGILARLDGRSAPLAMLMPTLAQPAPDLTYFDAQGGVHRLSDFRGKVVLLNFWATWCAPCRKEMPLLSSLQREHANDGLVVLYISLEEPEVLARFLASNRFDGVHGRLDHEPGYYDAGKFYPLSYLISRNGRVLQRWSGRPREDWLRAEIVRAARDSSRVAQTDAQPPGSR